MDFIWEVCGRGWGSGAGGKRRGLGPRNDVFTTYKAVTLRGGQRIIAVFSRAVNILEVRREPAEEIIKILKKIISCLFVFLSYRICLLVLKLRGKLKRKLQSLQPCFTLKLNQQQVALDRFLGYIVFAGRGHQKIIEVVVMLMKITGESVKFIGSKYIQESLINMSLQLYITHHRYPKESLNRCCVREIL